MRVLTHGSIDTFYLASSSFEFLNQEHLMDRVASQAIGGGDDHLQVEVFWERRVRKEEQAVVICYDEKNNNHLSKAGERTWLAQIDYRNGPRKCQPLFLI